VGRCFSWRCRLFCWHEDSPSHPNQVQWTVRCGTQEINLSSRADGSIEACIPAPVSCSRIINSLQLLYLNKGSGSETAKSVSWKSDKGLQLQICILNKGSRTATANFTTSTKDHRLQVQLLHPEKGIRGCNLKFYILSKWSESETATSVSWKKIRDCNCNFYILNKESGTETANFTTSTKDHRLQVQLLHPEKGSGPAT
jgi:hypothetical protein